MKNCNKVIYLTLSSNWYKKGDILITGSSIKLKVIRTYKLTWWRKLLRKVGFNIKPENIIKCKLI